MNITAQNLAAAMLTDARRTLAEPDCWTQKASARDLSGVSVDVLDAGAASFCVSGALLRAAAGAANGYDLPDIDPDNPPLALAFAALERAVAADPRPVPASPLTDDPIAVWNDAPARVHADVLTLYDSAIAGAAPPPEFRY